MAFVVLISIIDHRINIIWDTFLLCRVNGGPRLDPAKRPVRQDRGTPRNLPRNCCWSSGRAVEEEKSREMERNGITTTICHVNLDDRHGTEIKEMHLSLAGRDIQFILCYYWHRLFFSAEMHQDTEKGPFLCLLCWSAKEVDWNKVIQLVSAGRYCPQYVHLATCQLITIFIRVTEK